MCCESLDPLACITELWKKKSSRNIRKRYLNTAPTEQLVQCNWMYRHKLINQWATGKFPSLRLMCCTANKTTWTHRGNKHAPQQTDAHLWARSARQWMRSTQGSTEQLHTAWHTSDNSLATCLVPQVKIGPCTLKVAKEVPERLAVHPSTWSSAWHIECFQILIIGQNRKGIHFSVSEYGSFL